MAKQSPEFDLVRIPDPGQGEPVAEEAARLLLQSIQSIRRPTQAQILHTIGLDINGTHSFAAVDAGGLVLGTGGLLLSEEDGPSRAEIVNMAVSPDERGHGLGRKIMSALEEEGARLGITEIFGQPEPEALGFYQRLGCERRNNDEPFVRGEILSKALAG